MRAIELPTPTPGLFDAAPKGTRPKARPAPVTPPDATTTPRVDDRWRRPVELIARAVGEVESEWHSLFLAISGALLRKGVAPTELVSVVRAISIATGADDRTHDREYAARTTIERAASGYAYSGFGTLRARWPAVAAAFDEALAPAAAGAVGHANARVTPPAERLTADERGPPGPPPVTARTLAETTADLEMTIDRAPPGVTMIKAECGLGKSAAALGVMSRRASMSYATPCAQGLRAPAGSKSAMAVDKHALALQCVAELAALGTPAARLFGPLSLKDDGGAPVCKFIDIAGPLVAGGQRMQWELCERRNGIAKCPEYESCRAREGREGPTNARVAVGPHALLGALAAHAGKAGLLVIDEPQDFLESTSITHAELDDAIDHASSYFDGRFVAAIKPALYALRAFVDAAELGDRAVSVDATTAVRTHSTDVPESAVGYAQRSTGVADGDVVGWACAAPFPAGFPTTTPPILEHSISTLLRTRDRAQRIGRMSGVLRAVYRALASDYPVAARVESRDDRRRLVLTSARDGVAEVLRRDGPVVILDANADLHAPIIARIVGYEPPLHVFAAGDGAPIQRTLISTSRASRSAWKEDFSFAPTEDLIACVMRAFAWAAEDPTTTTLAIITFSAIELAIRYAAGLERDVVRAEWIAAGLKPDALDALDHALGPIVRAWSGKLLFAHYGATRGLNTMAEADALVTLGDPWQNLSDVANDTAFLHLGDWHTRYNALCQAELEQAHGRLRTVHRKRPGRALHVGRVMPGGSGWTAEAVDVRVTAGGRTRRPSEMPVDEVLEHVRRAGGVRALGRELGLAHTTVAVYAKGVRGVPLEVAERLRRVVSQGLVEIDL
ncbi:MAG: hypothetical protein ACHREM_05305, partial [Polyangiales bacterium]